MPYKVKVKGDQYCVVVSSGPKKGKEVACHASREKAVAQVRALYANDAAEWAQLRDVARKFSGEQRKKAAAKGQAQKDGSYPIKNAQDLKNAIQAYGRSKNKAATKAHIIRRARALGLTKLLPEDWVKDKAEWLLECPDCARSFLDEASLHDHSEAVHTFEDIRRLVNEAVREKYGKAGSFQASPPIPSTWVWVDDLAEDWVVYMVEEGVDSTLYKASYAITDNKVTLGEPAEVRRRTVYDSVNSSGG